MKRTVFILVFVCSACLVRAQVNDTVRILNVVPGSFSDSIAAYDIDSIYNLVVTGELNSSDFAVFGNDTASHNLPVLQYLDISGLVSDTIPQNTFKYYGTLTTCLLSDSLKVIGDNCFEATALTSIQLPKGVSVGTGGFVNSYAMSDTLRIPERVYLGLSAFYWGAYKAVIYESGNSGRNNFSVSKNLKYADFMGADSSLTMISACTFMEDYALETVKIPATVTLIDDYAFERTPELTEIYLHATTPPQLGHNAFSGIDNSKRNLYVPLNSIPAYKADEVWGKFNVQKLPTN